MLGDARTFARFLSGLRDFYAQGCTVEEARRVLVASIAERDEAFLRLAGKAIYGWKASPYLPLLRRAGVAFEDLQAEVRSRGLEPTLERLRAAGVYLTLDEFKGKRALVRPGLELPLTATSTDNPFLVRHFEAATGGTGGAARRLPIDLDLLRYETAIQMGFLEAAGCVGAPKAIWRPVPPGTAGIKRALSQTRAGLRLERWFTQEPFELWRPSTKSWAVTMAALAGSRLGGRPIPVPETTPLSEARRVAEWVNEVLRRGETPHLDTNVSSALLVLRAAAEAGFDLRGAFFRVGSESFTPQRARVFAEAGCRVLCHYSISETGPVAVACAKGEFADEAHFMSGKLALIAGEEREGGARPLYLTTLLQSTPKILLNVEMGDAAVVRRRECGCGLGRLGFDTLVHTIRSYEKLTSAGMHFSGQALLHVVETVLPGRFGGDPADYQFAEEGEEGLPVVVVRVHPRLGPMREEEVMEAVLGGLAEGGAGERLMSDAWRQSGLLRVERREPRATAVGKIPVLDQSRRRD